MHEQFVLIRTFWGNKSYSNSELNVSAMNIYLSLVNNMISCLRKEGEGRVRHTFVSQGRGCLECAALLVGGSDDSHTKRWEMRPLEQASFQLNGQRKLEPIIPHEWDQQFKPGLRHQAELAVLAAMGEAASDLPTLEDALNSMRLTQAIYRVM